MASWRHAWWALGVALALGACEQSSDAPVAQIESTRSPDRYETAAALATASDAVAEVEVVGETFRGVLRELPSAIFEARVVRASKGTRTGDLVRVRQFVHTDEAVFSDGVVQELRAGRRYLLFLVEEFPGAAADGDDRLRGLYGLLEGISAYEQRGSAFEALPGVELAGQIPHRVTLDQFPNP